MQKQNFKNSIVSFILITSTILMPFSFLPKKAEAQSNIYGYTKGLAPAIARLPQCQKEMGNGIKTLFNGIGSLFSGETGGEMDDYINNAAMDDYINNASYGTKVDTLDTLTNSKMIQATSSISDAEIQKQLKKINENLDVQIGVSKAINENSSCIASIGRLIAKMLLQKMTQSTVNWINGGFNGSPSFIQNTGKFFEDIAKTEILQFGLEIQNNPYGADWLRNQALRYKTKFADNAQYSLNEMIQQTNPDYSAATFQTDFSLGGWDAWMAMTQVPANNPLGFKLMADNEIHTRLAGTSQSTAQDTRDALQAANGFLGDERCVNEATFSQINYDVTKADYEAALKEKPPRILCSSWEYVTPGKMIADKATEVIGYENNSLLNVEDLNDAVAAVLDATLNQFSTSIYEKGFANIGYQGIDGVLVFSGADNGPYKSRTQKDFMPSHLSSSWLQENPEFDIRTDLTQALIDEQRTYSDKLALQNKELMSTIDGKEDYNIETCPNGWSPNPAYPDCKGPPTKTEYTITKLTSGMEGLIGTPSYAGGICPSGWTGNYPNCKGPGGDKKGISNAYGLMPAIYQLDYCIPGPHPGWEDDSRQTLASKLNSSVAPTEEKPNIANDIVNGAIGVGLNFVPYAGPILSSIFSVLTGGDAIKRQSTNTRLYFTNKFWQLTGFGFQAIWSEGSDPLDANMSSQEGLFYVLNTTLDRYIKIMKKTYFSSPDMLPSIAKDAAREFEKLSGYNQIIKENKDKMLEIKTIVSILGEIKDAVDNLNMELETGQKTEEEYEGALKAQINAFGRLSSSMVNGNDIAKAANLVEQIILQKNYVYKDLLKGPQGCEAFLQNQTNIKPFPSAGGAVKQTWNDWKNYDVNSVKRMTYPFPIIYDYNEFSAGTEIPDPWDSGYINNKMPTENKYKDELGPGFLSFVYFAASFRDTQTFSGSERLHLGDIINNYEPCGENISPDNEKCGYDWVSLGKLKSDSVQKPGLGLFEKTIGIY